MKTLLKITTFSLIAFSSSIAMACPDCKSALHDGLALGYATSILVMMGMPFLILAWWAITIWNLRSQMLKDESAELNSKPSTSTNL